MTTPAHDLQAASVTKQPSPGSTMRAVVVPRYGSADVLEQADIPRPTPADDEVLVEVRAAGVDRGTWHLMTGTPYIMRVIGFGFSRPKQPVAGLDVAGVVVAVGTDVTRFAVGDEVFGIGSGTFAEYAVVPERKLSHKPATVSFEEAASAGISGSTALQALTDVGRMQDGQRVLVIGASGGVGAYAVQMARALGGRVTGVASAAKAAQVRSMGAEQVIDYAADDYLDGSERYDIIIDAGGNNPVHRLRRALTPTGTLVIVGGEAGGRWTGGIGRNFRAMAMSVVTRQRLTAMINRENHETIDRVADLLASGSVVAPVSERYPLDRARVALADLEAGRITGKAVIVVRPADEGAVSDLGAGARSGE